MPADILPFVRHARSRSALRKRRKKIVGRDSSFGKVFDFRHEGPGWLSQSAPDTVDRGAVAAHYGSHSIVSEIFAGHPIGECHEPEGALYARACQARSAYGVLDSQADCAEDAHMSARHKLKPVLQPPTFLASWRVHRGIATQEEMAEKLGMTRENYSKLERGVINYTTQTLEASARILQCEPWQLLGQDPADPRWADRLIHNLDTESRQQLIKVAREFRQ